MAKLKTAAPVYVLPKVVHIDYSVHPEDKEDGTAFDAPPAVRTGAVDILVESDAQVHGAVTRLAGLTKGDKLHIAGIRVIATSVHTVVGGYHEDSTGAEPPTQAAPRKSAKKKSKK